MLQRVIGGCVVAGLLAFMTLAITGCAPKKEPVAVAAEPPPPPPPATLTQIKQELTQARAQLDLTTGSINTLAKSSNADVAANYDKLNTEYTKLQSLADICRTRSNDLKFRTQAYFDTWNKQAEVQNAELRRKATMQRNEAEQTFSSIKSEVELTKLSFEPYMSQVKDILSYLKDNKSPAALQTVSDLATKATADSTEAGKHIDAVLAGIYKIMAGSGEMAAPAPAAPAASAAPAVVPAAK